MRVSGLNEKLVNFTGYNLSNKSMNASQLLDNILKILYTVKEDKNKLEKIQRFLEDEIYEVPEASVEIDIPEKYKKVVSQIADSIDAGFSCYLNPVTLEIEEIHRNMMDDHFDYEDSDSESDEEISYKYYDWEKYIIFEPLESDESFKIMEQFAEQLSDNKLQNKLFNALNNRKPFANFKYLIDNSLYRQDWFDFKKRRLENHVYELLLIGINSETNQVPEEINGFYNDDGTKIDPDLVPVPGLCVICKKHRSADWEENMLCILNRNDYRNEDSFKCGVFEKI
jgi:hypothetical protein